MAKIKYEFQFAPGDQIKQRSNGTVLVIEYIDKTRNVYIFEGVWIHNLSEMKSYDAAYIDNHFDKIK